MHEQAVIKIKSFVKKTCGEKKYGFLKKCFHGILEFGNGFLFRFINKIKTTLRSIYVYIKSIGRIFLKILRLSKDLFFPPALSVYTKVYWNFASGRYALELRSELDRLVREKKRDPSSTSITVFHGLYSTVQPHFLKLGLKSLGIESTIETLDFNPGFPPPDIHQNNIFHPDQYYEQIKFQREDSSPENLILLDRQMRVTDEYNLSVLKRYFLETWQNFDVFHFNWFLSFLPDNIDVEYIRNSGRKVYFHFRGCFILAKIAPEFTKTGQSVVDACAHCKKMEWQRKYMDRFYRGIRNADRVFVSTPNLCHCLPQFEYFPLSLDPELELIAPPPPEKFQNNKTITILHAPSGSPIKRYEKGTDYIISAVEALQKEGLPVELKLIENLTRSEAVKIYGDGDIFIEQLHLGSYGNTAVEAMAYGMPVLSSNHPSHRHLMPDCPIIHVDPGNLLSVLRNLVLSPEEREALGNKCYAYVRNFHGNSNVSKHLVSIYQEDLGLKPRRIPNTLSNHSPNYSPMEIND